MSARPSTIVAGPIETDMFGGPARLRQMTRGLRRLPRPAAQSVLAALAIGDGFIRYGRFRQASAWAAAQGATGWNRCRMALALLANHGRFVADEAMLGISGADDLSRDVVIEGTEHLEHLSAGAILLGFHLGPPKAWLALRVHGYPVRFAGRLESARPDARWQRLLETGDVIRLPDGDAHARLRGLHRIRNLLREGSLVYLTADGPFGRESFRINLPGGPLVLRLGWFALRRATGVRVLPVLVHRDKHRRVVVIHPPLPDPEDDPQRDAVACQAALTPLVERYVHRYPTQCRWLAMPRWHRPSPLPS